ncbi:MAG TPA: hypothetical protein VHA37_03215, partial [Candidatus Saccharimonadales bacterium]|nr:hypothetical protein [Candidatus Saccharimonadales bacterium]
MLKRRQWFEFCDQPWLEGWMRDAFLDCLSFVHRIYQPYYHLAPLIAQWAGCRESQVLDLASGSGEQVAMLIRAAEMQNAEVPLFILSDLYPSPAGWKTLQEELGQDSLYYLDRPLSALNVPHELPRWWSIFTAFHHFPAPVARRLLEEFVVKGDGLCIIENQKRRWLDMV